MVVKTVYGTLVLRDMGPEDAPSFWAEYGGEMHGPFKTLQEAIDSMPDTIPKELYKADG